MFSDFLVKDKWIWERKDEARHTFSNEVSLSMADDFQLIPSEDARKRTKNVHP